MLAFPSPVFGADRQVGGWTVGQRDDVCSLYRAPSRKTDTAIFMSAYADGTQYIRTYDERWPTHRGQSKVVIIRLDGKTLRFDGSGVVSDGADRTGGFVASSRNDWLSDFSQSRTATISYAGAPDVVVDLAGFSQATSTLRDCLAQLKSTGQPSLKSRPVIVRDLILRTADYPASAKGKREEGDTSVLLTIGLNGGATSCEVVTSSGSNELDERACLLLISRTRYKPAVAADGRAVEAKFGRTVQWRLPKPN